MIVWCAYCQQFLGEKEPWTSMVLSHALCDACDASMESATPDVTKARRVADFLGRTGAALTVGPLPDLGETLATSRALGIRDADLLIGLLQPTLDEIGRRFELATTTVAHEHEVSAFVAGVLDAVEREAPAVDGLAHALLATAPGNAHTLGLRIFATLLGERGVASRVLSGAKSEEVLEHLGDGGYTGLGLSVALPAQLPVAHALAARALDRQPGLHVAMGGYVIKSASIAPRDAGEGHPGMALQARAAAATFAAALHRLAAADSRV